MWTNDHKHGADLADLEDRLRASRPTLSPLELDAVQRRVLAAPVRPTREGTTMKSRIAVIAMLVFGMIFSTAGAGLAVGGFADEDQASVAQYGTDDEGGVLGEGDEGGGAVPGGGDEEGGSVQGVSDDVAAAEQTEFTASAQTGGELPFTGFAAIPVLLIGLALLAAGTMLRRSSRTDGS